MKHLFFITVLVSLLAGCATSTIRSTSISNKEPLSKEHGITAIQVINNTGRLATFHEGWTEVIAIRLDNREELEQAAIAAAKEKAESKNKAFDPEKVEWDLDVYSLRSIPQGTIESQLFAGSMPTGEYVISSLYSFYSDGNISSWITMPVMFSAGTFKVEAGRFTDLGSIAFQPLLSVKDKSFWSNSSSQKAYIARMSDNDNLAHFVNSHFPKASQTIDFSNALGWIEDSLDDFRPQLSELSRNNAYGDHGILLANMGKGALAAKFGQLRVLKSDREWQQIDLPTNGQLSAVLDLPENVWIGGERGQVFIGKSFEGNWELTSPVAASEAVVWFGSGENNHYSLTSSAKAYTIYSVDVDNRLWKEIGSFTKKNKNDFFVQNGGLFPLITKQGTVRIINDNRMYDYDTKSNQWVESKGAALVSMSQMRDGTLLALEVSQWDGVGDQIVSFDDGNSWTTIKRRLNLWGDSKTDASLPAMLENGTLVSLGRVNKALRLISQKKADIGDKNKWQSHGTARVDCQVPVPELTSEQTLYFLCDQGQLVSTSDLGETWTTSIEINIADMQSKYEYFIDALDQQAKEKAKEKQATSEDIGE